MPAEQVPVWGLAAGDVIRVRHHHDALCGDCLSAWQTDVVVTQGPDPVSGRLAVRWAGDARLPGGSAGISGISVFGPDEQALRIGRVR